LFVRSVSLSDLEGEIRVREGPGAQKEQELEAPLRLGVYIVFDDYDPAALSGRRSCVAEHRDEIVHELRRRQTDFLRHPLFIAFRPASRHSR
jgi:hypothetical protein